MGSLSFTIGLPRAGKDTFSKKWRHDSSNRVVLSGDNFRRGIYSADYNVNGEGFARASLITCARVLYNDGYDVLINDTNTSIWNIEQILAIEPNAKAYMFLTPMDECIKRAYLTNKPYLEAPIRRMYNNLQDTLKALENGRIVIKSIEEVK